MRAPRASRARMVTAFVALALVAAACVPAKGGSPPPAPLPPLPSVYCHSSTPTTANGYQAAFNGLFATNAKGWAGSDGGHPVRLDANRVLWMFSDTVIGRRAPNGSVPHMDQLAPNGFVVQGGQQGRCFTPFTKPIPDPPQAGHWIWPIGADVHNGEIRVFGMQRRPGGIAGIFVRATVSRFSLDNPSQHLGTQGLGLPTNNNKAYGQTVAFDNEHIYAYGQTRRSNEIGLPVAQHYVARRALSNTGQWEFWAGTVGVNGFVEEELWLPDEAQAKPMLFEKEQQPGEFHADDGPAAAFSAGPRNGAFLASSLDYDLFGDKLVTWHGAAPWGPWDRNGTAVANIQSTTAKSAYSGRVALDIVTSPIAYWSIHPGSLNAILANSNLYRLRFAPPNPASLDPPSP